MDKELFGSSRGPAADTTNYAGGHAYSHTSEEVLAKYAATAMFSNVYYADGREQLDQLLKHAAASDPVFVAKAAVYSRENGWLKDAPAVLLAHVTTRFQDGDRNGARRAFRSAFPRVVDNGKMLRNFCQVIASNVVGRQNFGHTLRGVIDAWINGRHSDQLFRASVGGDKPSMADVIKMTRPKPRLPSKEVKEAELRYLIGRDLKEGQFELLSPLMQEYERFKRAKLDGAVGDVPPLPRVDFRLLDSLGLTKEEWKQIARDAKWEMTRRNLNTFQRHGVFEDVEMVNLIADRLANKEEVLRSRNYPYQLFQAYRHANGDVPHRVRDALQDAMEHATANVPVLEGNVVLALDVSGSMHYAQVGGRNGKGGVAAIEVAALCAAALIRRNPSVKLLPFSDRLNTDYRVNPRDSVMTIAGQLSGLPSGGTDCSLPLKYLNGANEKRTKITGVDAVFYISDNESWLDSSGYGFSGQLRPTGTMAEWGALKARNPKAKLICLDLTPTPTTQAPNGQDRLNIGGFNDMVFDVAASFINSGDGRAFVKAIDSIDLDQLIKRD